MNGKVIAVLVEAGQEVKLGARVAVMEAMKMEHSLTAPRDGIVAEVAAAGTQVSRARRWCGWSRAGRSERVLAPLDADGASAWGAFLSFHPQRYHSPGGKFLLSMGTAMTPTRRHFLAAAGACGLAAAAGRRADADGDAKVVLLGTKGGPRVNRGTANPSNLVIAGGRSYVVDCGYGVTRQLVNAGVEAHEVRTILITHNHSDHMLELGPLIYNAWAGGLREPIDVWGPPPLAKALAGLFRLHRIRHRYPHAKTKDGPTRASWCACTSSKRRGQLFEAPGLRVSATRVRHPPITHAYAYRFDTPGRSIVLSGDTTYSPELIALAEGRRRAGARGHASRRASIDLLARIPNAATCARISWRATPPPNSSANGGEAQVKKLVLSHFVPGDDPSITDAMWTEGVRKNLLRRDRARPRPHDDLTRKAHVLHLIKLCVGCDSVKDLQDWIKEKLARPQGRARASASATTPPAWCPSAPTRSSPAARSTG